jgi:hypothetical protein
LIKKNFNAFFNKTKTTDIDKKSVSKSSSLSGELPEKYEKTMEQNIVWIFGAGRSGTTWLAKELLSHNTNVIDEPYLGAHLATPGRNEKVHEFHKTRDDYFFSNAFKKTWIFFLRKLILNRIYFQTKDYSKYVIIKEPHGTLGAGNIVECLPGSKIIVVLRDGRDVLDSEFDANRPGGWSSNVSGITVAANTKKNFIRNQSNLWNKTMNTLMNVYENYPEEKKILVRYENLRQNTVPELERIYKFLKIDINIDEIKTIVNKYSFENIPDSEKGSGKSRRSATPGKWKDNFNEEEQELMNSLMEETMKRLGYQI